MYKDRILTQKIINLLKTEKSVTLTGSRQAGKTTLVKEILKTEKPTVYFSLDYPEKREYIRKNALRIFNQYRNKTIILDEIQKEPALLDIVKGIVDENPGQNGQFILLGSSHILLLKNIRESLAGRTALAELYPYSLMEHAETSRDHSPSLIKLITKKCTPDQMTPPGFEEFDHLKNSINHLQLYGGYPEITNRRSVNTIKTWFMNYQRTYLERDLVDIARVNDLRNFTICHKMLAYRACGLMNYSDFSRDVSLAIATVKKYIRYMEISYQVVRIPPFYINKGKRLIKAPKYYFVDNGILNHYLNQTELKNGIIYENWVVMEIYKLVRYYLPECEIYYYRTSAGGEVDIILLYRSQLIPVEIKNKPQLQPRDWRNVKEFLRVYNMNFGLTIYSGSEIIRLDKNIWAVPDFIAFGI